MKYVTVNFGILVVLFFMLKSPFGDSSLSGNSGIRSIIPCTSVYSQDRFVYVKVHFNLPYKQLTEFLV